MKRIRPQNLIVVVVVAGLIVLASGCGSSGGSSSGGAATTTSASATEKWASGVCSSITTWQSAVTSVAASVKSDRTKSGLQQAVGDVQAATKTLASDLKGLGKPDTQNGQQAADSLNALTTNLQQGVATIQGAAKDVSGLTGVATAVPKVTGTLATMKAQVKTTLATLQGVDAKGELKKAFTNSSACSSLK